MPHFNVPNATPQHPECHTSACPKCGISPREVWHFPPRSVALEGVKPFMYNHFSDKRTKRQNKKTNRFFCSSVKQTKIIMRNFHQHGIDTRGRISGRIKTICPQCNDTRGHKGNKSLSVDLDKGLCYCHHCGYKFYVPDDAEERLKQQRRDMRRKPAAPPSTLPGCNFPRIWNATGPPYAACLRNCCAPCASPKKRCACPKPAKKRTASASTTSRTGHSSTPSTAAPGSTS